MDLVRNGRSRPELLTARLRLRALTANDAAAVESLAGAREVAAGTLNIPHPYARGAVEMWLAGQAAARDRGEMVVFGIELRRSRRLVGCVSLRLELLHQRAELGYWVGVPHWGRGYATEAARACVAYGFEVLRLNRIDAMHFSRNAASGAVLRKAGFRHEGCLRQHVVKWGVAEDVEVYGILREDHERDAT